MAATSIQDIRDFHDIVRLLEEHPEWRAELRRLILTDEVLALPEQVTRMAMQVSALAEAQHRTETQIGALTTRIDELATAQTRTATQLAALTDVVHGLSDGVGTLKGEVLELRYGVRGLPSVGRLLRRSQVLSLGEVYDLLDDAVEHRALSEEERDKIAEADLIVRGKDRKTGTDTYLVLEVSWGVGPSDIERAAERAALLAKLGAPVLPAVAGREITRAAREQAQAKGVWQFINGTVVPATS
jgi:hypothetical protein